MLHAGLVERINLVHVLSLVGYSAKPNRLEPNGHDMTSSRREVGIMPQDMVANPASPQMDIPPKKMLRKLSNRSN
jgi:hypothetical protein